MSAEAVHLFALIALDALSQYDPIEYKRATDKPIAETERQIEQLLASDRVAPPHRNEATFLRERLSSMRRSFPLVGNESFMFRQLYISSMQRAMQLAAPYTHNATPENERAREFLGTVAPSRAHGAASRAADEFTRLGIQRLLRELPPYLPKYEYRAAGQDEVDCVLEAEQEDLPTIVIEAKRTVVTSNQLEKLIPRLRKYIRFWGKGTIGVVLAAGFSRNLADQRKKHGDVVLISFDIERNELDSVGLALLFERLGRT